jgi:hypothetical protein
LVRHATARALLHAPAAASAASAWARAFSVDSDDTVDGFIKVIYANKKIVQCFSTRNFSLLNLLCQFDG